MKLRSLAAAAMAASVLAGGAASATTIDFTYSNAGAAVATGSFTYATGDMGVLGFNDLTAFDITVAGVNYDLADVTPLTDYVQFAYDTSAMNFVANPNGCGFDGCGFDESLGAINSSGTYGFYFDAVGSGSEYAEYTTGTVGDFDTLTFSAAAVPEPGTWALIIVGFGGLGAALRMSRRASLRSGAAQSVQV